MFVCFRYLEGPPWTSSMDISYIIIYTILLNNSPLINEPGFENYTGNLSTDYSKMVEYENIKHHFYRNTINIPKNFLMFQDVVNKNFIDNKDKILKKLSIIKEKKDNFFNNSKFI